MVKITALISFLCVCLLRSVSTQLVYGIGRVITSYQFGGTSSRGITIAYRPRDYVRYSQSTTGVVGLAKVIHAQASTYAQAKQARERLSFVNDGNVLTWDNTGRYYYYQSGSYTLRTGKYFSVAFEFHDRQGRAIYRDNGTWAVSHATDCWVNLAAEINMFGYLTECKTIFDNEELWPTFAPTTERTFTTARQRFADPDITTLQPQITPPWSDSGADNSNTKFGPDNKAKAVGGQQQPGISTGSLVAAITVPFLMIIVVIIAIAVICVRRRIAAANNTNQPPPVRYDRQNGGQVNPVMIPAVSGNLQPDPNKHFNYQPSVTPQQQNLYQPLNSYSQMSAPYVQPISVYSSSPTQGYGYSYVAPNSKGPQAFAPVNRTGSAPVRRPPPPPPQHMPSQARPSTHRVMNTIEHAANESGYEYEGPQATAPEETTSNYYSDIVLTDEIEYSTPYADM